MSRSFRPNLLGANGLVDRTTCTQDSTPPLPAWWQYTLKGSGTETWTPQFFIHGCRYLQVQLYPAPGGSTLPAIQSLQGVAVHSTSTPIGTFSCSNPLFNQIYSLVRWAQVNNMESYLSDCPHRERLGWLEQDHLNGPSLRYNFDIAPLFTKIENDIFDSQWTNNGFVPNIAPEYFQTSDSLTDAVSQLAGVGQHVHSGRVAAISIFRRRRIVAAVLSGDEGLPELFDQHGERKLHRAHRFGRLV